MIFLKKNSLLVMAAIALLVTQIIFPVKGSNDIFPIFSWSIFSFSIPKTQTTTIRISFKNNNEEHVCYLTLCPRELFAGNRKELIWRVLDWGKNPQRPLGKPDFFTGLDDRITQFEILRIEVDHTKALSPKTITPLKVLGQWKN